MNLTSNFDYCIELGIASVKEIFHLAFKSEDRYPHNVGPLTRTYSGRQFTINVRVLDDEDKPADLSFKDEKHILFSFPFELTAETTDAPDPSLSRVTLEARVSVPALLTSWEEEGQPVLGLSFFDVTAADVAIDTLSGLPTVDIGRFWNAIHSRYDTIPHIYNLGGNQLVLYDGNRDVTLSPPNAATPYNIEAQLENHGGKEYLKIRAPIWVHVPLMGFGTYESFGRVIFWREVIRTDSSVTVTMGNEPADLALKTQVELDNAHPARPLIITNLQPLLVNTLAGYGTITEPAFSETAARQMLQEEIANYLKTRRYPVYSPKSPDPDIALTTPVGFLLVADGVLAILLNRRSGTEADDHAPDNFMNGHELVLAIGRAKVDEFIQEAINEEFPGVNDGGHEVHTDEGDATLYKLSVTPSDPGTHDESQGHLWVTGEAEVHIDCWPDPDVSFDGPIFINAHREDTPEGCGLVIEPKAGDFDFDQSCCDVFLDLIIPIVGWVVLIIVENTIDEVGGELAEEIAGAQGRIVDPVPKVVNGIAEITACLESLEIYSAGFIFPGSISIRRLGTSFDDLREGDDLPRP